MRVCWFLMVSHPALGLANQWWVNLKLYPWVFCGWSKYLALSRDSVSMLVCCGIPYFVCCLVILDLLCWLSLDNRWMNHMYLAPYSVDRLSIQTIMKVMNVINTRGELGKEIVQKNVVVWCSRVKSALGHGSSLCWNNPTGLYLIKLAEKHGEEVVIEKGSGWKMAWRADYFKCIISRLADWGIFLQLRFVMTWN